MKSGVRVTIDRVRELEQSLAALADRRVLVGFPRETSRRDNEPISNAELGYIHNYGAPEAHIPPRPFMEPALADAKDVLTEELKAAAAAILDGGSVAALEKGLHRVGITAQNAIKNKIDSNIPPPLADSTLAARRARHNQRTHTLIDTGKMRNAVTYVIRNKAGRDLAVGPTPGRSAGG